MSVLADHLLRDASGAAASPSPFWRDGTPLLKLFARKRLRQLQAQDPEEAQRRQLDALLAQGRRTRFGRIHDFASVRTVGDYQRAVPLRRYEAFWQEFWKPEYPTVIDCTWPGTVPYFALSSGTTSGVTKHIPCTREMIRANRDAMMDVIAWHVQAKPDTTLLGGRNFMLGGSTSLKNLAPGVWAGDLSGIAGRTRPLWVRPFYYPPRELESIGDWEEKIARLAPASLAQDVRGFGGTPSWMLLFLDRLAALRPGSPRRLASFWPNLQLLVHGGVNFAPYRAMFAEWLKGSRAETREVYPASEGFIAGADRGSGEGMRMSLDHGLFYEFVPVEELDSAAPTRHWIGTVETGVNYAIVLTTCAGLWSYVIGDTVRLVDRNPPRLLVTGRTTYSLSAFGEHLIGEEIERAVAAAADAIGRPLADFSVGAVFPEREGDLGFHLYVVEFAAGIPDPPAVEAFAQVLDETLCTLNVDYRDHRSGGFGMKAPAVRPVAPGTFAAWMKRRGKLGGQNKVPRIINDQTLFADLRAFAGA